MNTYIASCAHLVIESVQFQCNIIKGFLFPLLPVLENHLITDLPRLKFSEMNAAVRKPITG